MCSATKVMISDREKTAIDCIDHPPLAGGVGGAATIVATASRRFDWNKAADYLERIGAGALVRRFGWLADHAPEHRVPGAIGYYETWRLFVNVSREELYGIAGLGQRKTARKGA